MEQGTLTYSINIAQDRLNALCDAAIGSAVTEEAMEVNGVEVVLQKAGSATAQLEGKSVVLELPLNIDLRRQAGLFTVEGSGGISLKVKVSYDINSDLQLRVKSELLDHQWITKPVLELGALNVPVETLMNLMLSHYESILTAKIDEAINTKGNLSPAVYQAIRSLEDKINDQLPVQQRADLKLGRLANMTPRTEEGIVRFRGNLELGLSLQSGAKVTDDLLPTVEWIATAGESKPLQSQLLLTYDDIAQQILTLVANLDMGGSKLQVTAVDISYEDQLQVHLTVADPIKGKVVVEGQPSYDSTAETITLQDLDVKVQPSNIIYKMTAPLVNRFIEHKLEDFLPVALGELVSKQVAKMPESIELGQGVAKPDIDSIVIDAIDFTSAGVSIAVRVVGAHLHVDLV